LRFEEREDDGSAENTENGSYVFDEKGQLVLQAVERKWSWKDDKGEGDSGIDVTDLRYPIVLKDNGKVLDVCYLEVHYNCDKA